MVTVTLSDDKENLILNAHYAYRYRLHLIPGAEFDYGIKSWIAPVDSLKEVLNEFSGELYFKTPLWKILGEKQPPKEPIKFFNENNKNVELPELKLKPYKYQEEGIRFMIDRLESEMGFTLLADDVGLGKTIQSIAVMQHFKKKHGIRKILIICKKSIKTQWKRELVKITGDEDLNIFMTEDTKKKRVKAYEEALNSDECILITNYHNYLNDTDYIRKINFEFVIIDEVHCIKGRKGKMNNNIGEIIRNRKIIFLTGTPIMSKPDDIFGIVQMASPDYFGEYKDFSNEYIVAEIGAYGYQIIGAKNLDVLSSKIKAFMMRRTNEDVSIELPEVSITQVTAEMDNVQKSMSVVIQKRLERIAEMKSQFLDKKGKPIPEYLPQLTELADSEKMFLAAKQFIADDPRCFAVLNNTALNKQLEGIVPPSYDMSPKTEATLDLVEDIINAGNKVIIFTHFETPAAILAEDIKKKLKANVLLYTGKISDKERDENIAKFIHDVDYNILIGNEACAEGLNLQCANYLINYEQADTYAQKQQRIGRIRRVGSNFNHAHVYDMITDGDFSYDVKKINKIERDKNLSASLIDAV